MQNNGFTPDPKLQALAASRAASCVAQVQKVAAKAISYRDEDVPIVEETLEILHALIPVSRPTANDLLTFSEVFGSYLGETLRLNHGGVWGVAHGTPAILLPSGLICYPWMRVYKRLTNGYEDNVEHWYQYAIRPQTETSGPPPLPPQARG